MLEGILLILLIGFLAGEIAGRLGLPKLIGMIVAGILIGPYAFNLLPQTIMEVSEEIRLLALLIILFIFSSSKGFKENIRDRDTRGGFTSK